MNGLILTRQWLPSVTYGWLLLVVLVCPGCRTPSFGPVDLQAPGWRVRQGQAVWQRPNGQTEIAGEILLATRSAGQSFVQFSKNGFPLLIAQARENGWTVNLPTENKRYSGSGLPPRRLFILQLPRALAGQPLPSGWSWKYSPEGNWRLANERTGETLEGYFNQ